jgi:hypothetical protein
MSICRPSQITPSGVGLGAETMRLQRTSPVSARQNGASASNGLHGRDRIRLSGRQPVPVLGQDQVIRQQGIGHHRLRRHAGQPLVALRHEQEPPVRPVRPRGDLVDHARGQIVGQRAQSRLAFAQLARAPHLRRDLGHRAEEPLHPAFVVAHRRVREREERFLQPRAPVHLQAHVAHVDRLAREDAVDQRGDVGLDLAPHFQQRSAQRLGMLAAQQGCVAVIVEQRPFRPPGDEHRLPRPQHHPDQRPQRRRPALGRAQRRRAPVVRAHGRAQRATVRQERRACRS